LVLSGLLDFDALLIEKGGCSLFPTKRNYKHKPHREHHASLKLVLDARH
jgi:hypothetical protein